jgi:protein SCO1
VQRLFLVRLALLVTLALATVSTAEARAERGADYFTNLPVVNQHGEVLRFYDDVLEDKIVIISFIYTTCSDLCPLTTARLAELRDKLGDAVGRDIFFVSLTVDPERDTPEMMKMFADSFDAGPGWLFLTGEPENILRINYKLGDRSAEPGRDLGDHRNEIVLGNASTGDWRRDSVLSDLDRIAMTVRSLDPEWRKVVRVVNSNPAMNTGYQISEESGQALFKKICSPCHTIGVGDKVGPDLRGVVERRERAWLVDFIRDPRELRKAKDPVALALMEEFPGVRMPRLGISENDAADLIAYLENQTARISEGVAELAKPPHER